MALDAFLVEAEKWVAGRDYAVLSRVDMNHTDPQAGDSGIFPRYQAVERSLRNELARWRRTRGTDQEYRPSGFLLSILREGTPLDVERRLLRWRWEFLEDEEQEHHFDLELLIIYFLKLQILRRLLTFDKEAGLKTFQNLCEAEV